MQNKQKEKQLTNLADDLLKKVELADSLKEVAKRNPKEASRISTIIDTFMNPGSNISEKEKIYNKIDIITSLIDVHINIAKKLDSKNFDWLEYHRDNGFAFNVKTKISSTGIIEKKDLLFLNKLYKKHLRLNKILNQK